MAQMQHGEHREADECLQFSRPRENFAVIELNDVSIAGDFVVDKFLNSKRWWPVTRPSDTHALSRVAYQ